MLARPDCLLSESARGLAARPADKFLDCDTACEPRKIDGNSDLWTGFNSKRFSKPFMNPAPKRPSRDTLPRLTCVLVAVMATAGCGDKSPPAPKTGAVRDANPKVDEGVRPVAGVVEGSRADRLPDLRGVAFADVARERGLVFSWPEQPRPIPILETFGSGCAAFDGNNDGWHDLLLVADPHPALFRNTGQARFENVTPESGLDAIEGDWTGCAVGDYDADGLLDLLLTGYHRLALYRNLGDLRFELVTARAGLDPANGGRWGASCGMMDLDNDGRLDLVILNYVVYGPDAQKYCEFKPGVRSGCTPREYTPERGEIWRGTEAGVFERVPHENGMNLTSGAGLVLAFTDLDGDRRIDFYIGNDGTPADVMHNLGDMRFENVGLISGLAVSETTNTMSAMGADWGDFDRDGRLDLTVTNFQKLSFAVFRNLGNASFRDLANRVGVARATRNRLGFGAKWIDFENDGWPDLAFVNGHVYDNADQVEGPDVSFRQPVTLMRNERAKSFVELTPALGDDVRRPLVGRGSAAGDFNNDGLIDLAVVDYEGPVMLLENKSRTGGHWLSLDLRGLPPNRFAYGARVTARAGDTVWVGEVAPASSYLSSSDLRIHWGLGDVTTLETLSIDWPTGATEILTEVAVDRILRIEESPR
jgi:enediyne biosynthesis protein E4